MGETVTINLRHVARGLGIPVRQVQTVVELLDDGNTVPFITRYRKDQTGGLDEEQIRQVQARLTRMRLLAERKQTILRSIEAQGKLTEKLAKQIQAAGTTKRLEDLYLPYKPKKQTLATQARSRGLEPLANEILEAAPSCANLDARAADFVSPDRQIPAPADALLGAGHILAEQFSEKVELRQQIREILHQTGRLVSTGTQITSRRKTKAALTEKVDQSAQQTDKPPETDTPKSDSTDQPTPNPPTQQATEQPTETTTQVKQKLTKGQLRKQKAQERKLKAFCDYFDYCEEIRKIPPHRVLAINRGERAKVLRVRLEYDSERIIRLLDELLVPAEHPHAEFLRGCARDAMSRLIMPTLERETRRELTERAETHAVGVFARNLRNLLLQPPVHGHRILAVDPGLKSGCKLAALDQFGNLLHHDVIYLVGKADQRHKAETTVIELISRFGLTVVAIGNGTGCRETEQFFAKLITERIQDQGVAYVIVNEAGASVYSTSRLGREEFPDYDATLRGAISIGRRLQDPLSELVKIDPANIGVGLYQHDIRAKHLRSSLDEVVESCVNYVGVNVNTASPALLRYVSGLNQLTARRVYEHRLQHGPFRTRQQLNEVAGFGEATFVQAVGFLKITGGDNSLDATWIHPESYDIATRALEQLGRTATDMTEKKAAAVLAERVSKVDLSEMAPQLGVGILSLKDILSQLARPGRDPREDLPAPVFKRGILKIEDLTVGMELIGTVLNVVDFGAFVDIGMHDSGLVHVSQLGNKYVRDPHDVIAVGDIVKVWVVGVDKERRRVSLTMLPPGSERADSRRGSKPGSRGERPARSDSGEKSPTARKPRPKGPPRSRAKRAPKTRYKPKSRSKPVVPITEAMKAGTEPMRTFGELAQFFDIQQQNNKERVNNEMQDARVEMQNKSGKATDAASQTPSDPPKSEDPPDETQNTSQ